MTLERLKLRSILSVALLVSLISPSVAAEPAASSVVQQDKDRFGVTDKDILIGSCVALAGRQKANGQSIIDGANFYFSYVNEQGGINGRRVKLISCDDGYDPDKAITCFNTCLKDKVFAGAFFHSSPTITKYVRMGDANQIPLVGFLAGTPAVYDPHPLGFTIRPSYKEEVDKQIQELWKHGLRKIAIAYQDDAFGAAIRENAMLSLRLNNSAPVAQASFDRTSSDIADSYSRLKAANPDAVLVGITNVPMKAFIQKKNDDHWDVKLLATSPLEDIVTYENGKAADGFIISQVFPGFDSDAKSVKLFKQLHDKYAPGTPLRGRALEAFINAILIVEALKLAGPDLTRSKFVHALESMSNVDLGLGPDYKISFNSASHVGLKSHVIYMKTVREGKLTPTQEADWKHH